MGYNVCFAPPDNVALIKWGLLLQEILSFLKSWPYLEGSKTRQLTSPDSVPFDLWSVDTFSGEGTLDFQSSR